MNDNNNDHGGKNRSQYSKKKMPDNDIPEVSDNYNSEKKENTRSQIARWYIIGFFFTILLVFVLGFIKCFKINDFKDMLITVSGILSGPLGFIVGYYFKATKE